MVILLADGLIGMGNALFIAQSLPNPSDWVILAKKEEANHEVLTLEESLADFIDEIRKQNERRVLDLQAPLYYCATELPEWEQFRTRCTIFNDRNSVVIKSFFVFLCVLINVEPRARSWL